MQLYEKQHEEVQAEQFHPDHLPWPKWVRRDTESCTGFSVVGPDGEIGYEVHPDDFIVYLRAEPGVGTQAHADGEGHFAAYPVRAYHFRLRYRTREGGACN